MLWSIARPFHNRREVLMRRAPRVHKLASVVKNSVNEFALNTNMFPSNHKHLCIQQHWFLQSSCVSVRPYMYKDWVGKQS